MPETKVIIVKEGGGACYTRAGENEGTIVNKAFIFLETWGKEGDDLKKPSFIQDDRAWDTIMELYKDDERVSWIKKIKEYGLNIMACNEQDLREFMSVELFDKRAIRKKSSINNMCSAVRGMFRAIGREHGYGSGQVYNNLGRFLVNSGNPMTTATERYLEEKLEKRMKDQGETSKKKIDDKFAFPLSVVSGYVLVLYHLKKLVDQIGKWKRGQIKQVERIINLSMMVVMYVFLLHEGSRPNEVLGQMQHKDMFFPLHKRVYMLTLTFLSPTTLRFLIEGNKIPYYVCGFYKSKTKKTWLMRMKSVIPCAYNVLDLCWIYTICMKIRLMLGDDVSCVFKEGLNMTSLRYRLLKHLDLFANMTFYSFRYGAAEEDKKGHIDPIWTRQRMGHSVTSMMKERYAKNLENRVGDCPLGMDNYETATNAKVISLEMRVIGDMGCSYDTKWLDESFGDRDDMKSEFVMVSDLVERFCENDDLEAYQQLKDHFHETHVNFGIKDLPIGTHIAIPGNMLRTDDAKKLYESSRDGVSEGFKKVNEPRIVPELWSFPQVMYGNWRKLLDVAEKYKSKDFIIEPSRKRAADTTCDEKVEKKLREERVSKEEEEEGGDACCCADIEKGDHVVILCADSKDACALRLPNIDKYVWVGKADRGMKRSGEFKGKLYRDANGKKRLDGSLVMKKDSETIEIIDDSVVHIFAAEPGVKFELSEENINEIEARFL